MFVQSARFVAEHQKRPASELSIHGQEKVASTVALCRMNLAIHGLEGNIREGNSYYEDLHASTGKFDFLLANPPFNVDSVDKERLGREAGQGRRYTFGLPKADNANYLWIQLFFSSLNARGRAGFVMANSAADARGGEQEIRGNLLDAQVVDVLIAVGPNMFYTVALPCTLWFFDRAKKQTSRSDTVLFVDARNVYRQIDRAHRDWTDAQISFLANIVRLYRGQPPDYGIGAAEAKGRIEEVFGSEPRYKDIPGLCKVVTRADIAARAHSLNPGRYVGVAPGEPVSDQEFAERIGALNEEFETLSKHAEGLEQTITRELTELLEES
jgi:type I restriction enzyme M protein